MSNLNNTIAQPQAILYVVSTQRKQEFLDHFDLKSNKYGQYMEMCYGFFVCFSKLGNDISAKDFQEGWLTDPEF